MKVKARAALELMRPANIITAFADILAGFAAAGGVLALTSSGFDLEPDGVGWLLLATFGLYGGGIVFNDVFDASIDAEERPERAIPSGDRKSTRLNSSHVAISYAVFCLKKKNKSTSMLSKITELNRHKTDT